MNQFARAELDANFTQFGVPGSGQEFQLVIQGQHMVSDTLALLGMICCDSGLRAGQWPQRADVLQNTGVNFLTSIVLSFRPSVLLYSLAQASKGLTWVLGSQL